MRRKTGRLINLLSLLLAAQCSICQRSTDQDLCQDCERQLRQCQLPHPHEFWQPPLPVLAWGNYSGTLKRSLAALKYNNQACLARPLGQRLAQAWLASPASRIVQPIVVPIPLHISKQRQRGYNQAELIAQAFCQETSLPLQAQGLMRIRATEAQFGLDSQARSKNLAEAFQLGQAFQKQHLHRPVLLLDDIYTTGTTVRSAAETLRHHRISVAGVIAVAKTAKS